jgi:hypothetical protein
LCFYAGDGERVSAFLFRIGPVFAYVSDAGFYSISLRIVTVVDVEDEMAAFF